MISRLFQKTGCGGGGKKKLSAGIPEVKSPSAAADIDGCSYHGSVSATEHVPCFSMTAAPPAFNSTSFSELPPPPPSLSSLMIYDPSPSSTSRFPKHSAGASAFPTLKSLQENLHVPFFFSTVAPPSMHGGAEQMINGGAVSEWPTMEYQKNMLPSELDCMWS